MVASVSQQRRSEATDAAAPELTVNSLGAQVRTGAGASEELQRALRSAGFEEQLDKLREDVRNEFNLDKTATISAAGVTLGASVAYVLWLIRGGVLMSSYLSALPAWRVLDPLPVLGRMDDESEDDEDEDDLDAMVDANAEPATTLRGF